MMRDFQQSSLFFGANAPYVEELYEHYLLDPAAVPEAWRKQFDSLPNVAGSTGKDVAHTPIIEAFAERAKLGGGRIAYITVGGGTSGGSNADVNEKKSFKVLQFIRAHRVLGSRHSSLDPLKRSERLPVPELELNYYGLTDADMETEFAFGSWQGGIAGSPEKAKLKDISAPIAAMSASSTCIFRQPNRSAGFRAVLSRLNHNPSSLLKKNNFCSNV